MRNNFNPQYKYVAIQDMDTRATRLPKNFVNLTFVRAYVEDDVNLVDFKDSFGEIITFDLEFVNHGEANNGYTIVRSGTRLLDSENNEFCIADFTYDRDSHEINGCTMRGQGGTTEVSALDLHHYKILSN